MLDLKFTKQRFKDHLYYSKWLYLIFISLAVLGFSLIFSITEPEVPKELKVDINVFAVVLEETEKIIWEEEILHSLSQDQQEVNINTLGFTGSEEASLGISVFEIMTTKIVAKEDDIFIMPKDIYIAYAKKGVFIAMDDIFPKYEFPEELDLQEYKVRLEENIETDGDSHLYCLPLDNVKGLNDLGIDPTDKVLVVLVYTENYDNVLKAVDYIMNKTVSVYNDSYVTVGEQ